MIVGVGVLGGGRGGFGTLLSVAVVYGVGGVRVIGAGIMLMFLLL